MKAYKKDHLESYTAGVFVTLELLNHHLEDCTRVILHSKGMKNQGVQKILAICEASHIPYEINDRQTEKLSHKENCYAIGVFRKYPCQLMPGKNHVALVNPGDMGNLGTIMRTMVGFGMEDLAIIRPGVDAYDPKVIRASMGSIFHLRFAYFDDFETYLQQYPRKVYCLMLKGATNLAKTRFETPYALVFGNESSGLPDEFLQYGQSVLIHHTDKIDSLNLSMALGITLYEATRETMGRDDDA